MILINLLQLVMDRYGCKTCSGEHVKQWRDANTDRFNEQNRIKYVTNLQAKISKSMHNKLNKILRRGIYTTRTEQIIGLNMTIFLEWLSYNFEGPVEV